MADTRPPLAAFEHAFGEVARLELLDGRSWVGIAIRLSPQAVAYPPGGELQVNEVRPRMSLRRDHFPIVETDAEIHLGASGVFYVDGIDAQDDEVRHVFVRELRR